MRFHSLECTPFRDSRCSFIKGRVALMLYLMTPFAQKFKITKVVVAVVVILVVHNPLVLGSIPEVLVASLTVPSLRTHHYSQSVCDVIPVLVAGTVYPDLLRVTAADSGHLH